VEGEAVIVFVGRVRLGVVLVFFLIFVGIASGFFTQIAAWCGL